MEVRKIFRLMVFNVLSHNRDDHAKNFAFLFQPGTGWRVSPGWRLSPGFDLTFSQGPGGEHTTAVCGEGRSPGAEQFSRVALSAGLGEKEAKQIVAEVRDAVARWPAFARDCGVRKTTAARIAKTVL
jgi:serine/threonine-protein kinase HipA